MLRKTVMFFVLLAALLGFEAFNYSTNEFGLAYFYPVQTFAGIRWAVLLAAASCVTDLVGLTSLFLPTQGNKEIVRVLQAGWLVSAGLDAVLTWWGTTLAIVAIPDLGNEVVGRAELIGYVPAFLAWMVLLIRISLVGGLSVIGEELKMPAFRQPKPTRAVQAPRPQALQVGRAAAAQQRHNGNHKLDEFLKGVIDSS
jgi:hypothetical protein